MIPQINIADYTYSLPNERIALFPEGERDMSKLLVYSHGEISNNKFVNLSKYLANNDSLVFNNTKVIQARLLFKKQTGATIEVFCIAPQLNIEDALSSAEQCVWQCTIGNAKKWKDEELTKEFQFEGKKLELKALKTTNANEVLFTWGGGISFANVLEACGQIPIPPYIKRELESTDKQRYQTVYSKQQGSVAAPTAGLHFTENVINSLKDKNIDLSEVTLHVGAGTFMPVKTATAQGHLMHSEVFKVERKTLENICSKAGSLIAVGTTSVRMLESLYQIAITGNRTVSQWQAYQNEKNIPASDAIKMLIDKMYKNEEQYFYASTSIMIVPGYEFKMIKGLITNFHQPESTLILLITALLGERWRDVYNYALENNFRFLSYGDSSLLLP